MPGKLVLDGVTLEVQPRQMSVLAGQTGAGKTTISYLLARLYDPDRGVIEVDGHDVRDITLKSLRSQIGVVTQDIFLLNTSLQDNLLYERSQAIEARLEAAVEAARLTELVSFLSKG